jgi:hypothetical protein
MRSTSSAIVVNDRIPRDEGLPQLRRLLDPREMAPVLECALPPTASVSRVRVLYLRYKPATRLVVRYAVTVGEAVYDATALAEPAADLAGWAVDPGHVALARKVNGRTPAVRALSYDDELGALIQWLPLDLTLPALAEEPAELRDLLRTAGVEIAPNGDGSTLLAYKARRRAVLRLDGHVVKIYAGAADFENAVVGLSASAQVPGLAAPQGEAVLPDVRLTCQTMLAGTPPQGHHAAAEAAGSALATWHRAPPDGLHSFPPDRQLAAAASSANSTAAVAPELRERLQRLIRELERAAPDAADPVAAHGDFHANQVLELEGGLAVIDFDEICAAPAALDFSSYVAHLVNGGAGELDAAATALDDLVTGYGSRPAGLSWYVATSIVRRAPFPFRFMDERWPERTEQMVADAEAALAL